MQLVLHALVREDARVRALVLSISLALMVARAANAESPSASDKALYDFDQGSQLLRDGKAKEALPLLEASMAALPSPNTELLIAHATRELGDRPLALEAYEKTVELASIRIKAGETRFVLTLDDAEHWASELRAELAKLSVVVEHADATTRIRLDGQPLEAHLDETSSTLARDVWHEPGSVRIDAEDSASHSASTSAELTKGLENKVVLDLGHSSIEPPPIASWALTGVGVVAVVTFAVFEAKARSAASTLSLCSPHCSPNDPSLVSLRDSGKRDQTVAGVSIGIGVASLAAAGLMWAFWPRTHSKPKTQATIPLSKDVRLGVCGPLCFTY